LAVSGPVLVDEPIALPNFKAGTNRGHVYPVHLPYRRLIVVMLELDGIVHVASNVSRGGGPMPHYGIELIPPRNDEPVAMASRIGRSVGSPTWALRSTVRERCTKATSSEPKASASSTPQANFFMCGCRRHEGKPPDGAVGRRSVRALVGSPVCHDERKNLRARTLGCASFFDASDLACATRNPQKSAQCSRS
jgi:hypothetical protein